MKLDNKPLQTAVMVDLTWFEHKKPLFKPEETHIYYARDYQVFPFYDIDGGYKYGNMRMFIYVGVTQEGKYLTEDGVLWDPMMTTISGRKDIHLGGEGCGCREIAFSDGPPGLHQGYSTWDGRGVDIHPLRLTTFDKMLGKAEECELHHRSIMPVIYAELNKKAAKTTPLKGVRVWTPNKGFITVYKTPIPVCLVPFTDFATCYNSQSRKQFSRMYHVMITLWARAHGVVTLYMGYDFMDFATPSDDKINHLCTKQELEEDPNEFKPVKYEEMPDSNVLTPVDTNYTKVLKYYHDGSLPLHHDYSLYGSIEL